MASSRGDHLHPGHVGAWWSVSEQSAPADSLHQSDPPAGDGGGGGGAVLLLLPGHPGRVPAPTSAGGSQGVQPPRV